MQVHIIVGLVDFKNIPDNPGVMADVGASPNDPLFINHHSMVDCIFDQWLKKDPSEYPADDDIKPGHGNDEYTVPFFPLIKHSDVFKTADNFGYICELSAAFILKPLTWVILVIIGITPVLSA